MQFPAKSFLTLVLATAGTAASAQQPQFGIIAGPQATSASYRINAHDQPTTWKAGGHIGAIAKIPFEGNFYFTPAITYTMKGFGVTLRDTSSNPGVNAVSNDIRLHAVEIQPLFTIYIGKSAARPYVQFGPAADINISGTEKIGLKNGGTLSRGMTFSSETYGRITASVIVRAGFETAKGLFFGAYYDHGFGSLNQNDYGPRIVHRVAGLSIGKYFANKYPGRL